KVERYRTYSNGKRVGPDEFYDYGHFVDMHVGKEYLLVKYENGNEWYIPYPWTRTNVGDSIYTRTVSHQLSTLGTIRCQESSYKGYDGVTLGDWEAYHPSRPVDNTFSLCDAFDNPDYPSDAHPCGWYYAPLSYNYEYITYWKPNSISYDGATGGGVRFSFEFYDQFLVVDGRRIDFSKLHKLKFDYHLSETDFSDPDKYGKIIKLEADISYLGKNFYGLQIDTFYVAK
ncbi:MAG: hypothetical protein K2G91_03550, partial [Prevotella sp.]|nr:hypothetical protein [Prevotella sp.]